VSPDDFYRRFAISVVLVATHPLAQNALPDAASPLLLVDDSFTRARASVEVREEGSIARFFRRCSRALAILRGPGARALAGAVCEFFRRRVAVAIVRNLLQPESLEMDTSSRSDSCGGSRVLAKPPSPFGRVGTARRRGRLVPLGAYPGGTNAPKKTAAGSAELHSEFSATVQDGREVGVRPEGRPLAHDKTHPTRFSDR